MPKRGVSSAPFCTWAPGSLRTRSQNHRLDATEGRWGQLWVGEGRGGHLPHLVQEVRLQGPLLLAELQGCFVEPDEGVFPLALLGECHHCLVGL